MKKKAGLIVLLVMSVVLARLGLLWLAANDADWKAEKAVKDAAATQKADEERREFYKNWGSMTPEAQRLWNEHEYRTHHNFQQDAWEKKYGWKEQTYGNK
jgi:hypothetical protein